MKRICVFCGSSPGVRREYREAAISTASALIERRLGLVYGGAGIGLMGVIADAMLAAGGEVIGVIPNTLVDLEIAHPKLTEMRVVHSMHERKAAMADLSDGFIAMPGGFGTLEEFSEVITWLQLGIHQKPCGLLNICDYFGKLIGFMDHAVEEGFIKPKYRSNVMVASDASTLLDAFGRFAGTRTEYWPSRRGET